MRTGMTLTVTADKRSRLRVAIAVAVTVARPRCRATVMRVHGQSNLARLPPVTARLHILSHPPHAHSPLNTHSIYPVHHPHSLHSFASCISLSFFAV
ncbi:hypothetical protein CALCODRAFT_229781 [Calocera cornea HHB12733]|uniref:Uncharacterized protein n=1 Tax=Calocera cornea HHB12733 TaxID=1353952 RepID=A0A165GYM0_9BASI|nr:hypothetical protein CALCODRAFT_229781 [Calocera cornea HHB12733]